MSRNVEILPKSIVPFQTAVEQRGGKVTWAVIPHRLIESQNNDGNLVKELKQTVTGGHEIAMHGYNHICPKCTQSSHEMFCVTYTTSLPYSQQLGLVNDGLKLLKDSLNSVPKLFVPPGHYADTITYQALIDKNFEFLSSTGGTKRYIYKNLYNLQQNNEYTWQLMPAAYQQNLKNALKDVRTFGKTNGYYCILLHDPFIRSGYNGGLVITWINELLDSLNLEYGTKIKYRTLSQAAKSFKDIGTSVDEQVNSVPENFVLEQNFPNPFNPSTVVHYWLPVNGWVSLTIYDNLGRLVKTLVNEEQCGGKHEVEFNASELSSGLYFYTLRSLNFIVTKKMILMK
jgi:predicted deacetylase